MTLLPLEMKRTDEMRDLSIAISFLTLLLWSVAVTRSKVP